LWGCSCLPWSPCGFPQGNRTSRSAPAVLNRVKTRSYLRNIRFVFLWRGYIVHVIYRLKVLILGFNCG
jgi:hypothetical protein